MTRFRAAIGVLVATIVLISGCTGLFPGTASDPEGAAVTPLPVPEAATETAQSPTPSQYNATVTQPRYLSLSPTCERPPGLVIHIQIEALRNNDPATNEGIRTVWRFASPSNKEVTGPYRSFLGLIRSSYQPLLTADSVTYAPVTRVNDTVSRTVTVTSGNTSTAYEWIVTRQSGAPYDGCWMTSGVTEVRST